MKKCFLKMILFILLQPLHGLYSQSITVKGSWSLSITVADLIAGPGSDLETTYQSMSDQITMEVKKSGATPQEDWDWRIDVSRSDLYWPAPFHLDIRRTSNGIGLGSIWGGTSFQEITEISQMLFYGRRNRKRIGMQLQLRGVSVDVEPDAYQTVLVYTVVEL